MTCQVRSGHVESPTSNFERPASNFELPTSKPRNLKTSRPPNHLTYSPPPSPPHPSSKLLLPPSLPNTVQTSSLQLPTSKFQIPTSPSPPSHRSLPSTQFHQCPTRGPAYKLLKNILTHFLHFPSVRKLSRLSGLPKLSYFQPVFQDPASNFQSRASNVELPISNLDCGTPNVQSSFQLPTPNSEHWTTELPNLPTPQILSTLHARPPRATNTHHHHAPPRRSSTPPISTSQVLKLRLPISNVQLWKKEMNIDFRNSF